MRAPTEEKEKTAGFAAVFFMGLGIQFAGLVCGWNPGIEEGMVGLIASNLLVGALYIFLSLAFAELTSVVAFTGGSFGYCRATLGPYLGFLVGASEMLENFFFVVLIVLAITAAITEALSISDAYNPVWYAAIYIFMGVIHLAGGSVFENFVISCGILAFVLVALFCIGGMTSMDADYAFPPGQKDGIAGGSDYFLQHLRGSTWFYIGIEIVPQMCERVKDVGINLPRGLICATFVSFVFSMWVIVAACMNAPGVSAELALQLFPLSDVYHSVFRIPRRYAGLLAVPSQISAGIGFMYGCGFQVASMAKSGTLPSIFAASFRDAFPSLFAPLPVAQVAHAQVERSESSLNDNALKPKSEDIPQVTFVLTSVLQFVLCCVWKSFPMAPLYSVVVIGACLVYVGVFVAYLIFRTRFGGMRRQFVSPFGMVGSVVGIGLALLLLVGVVKHDDNGAAISIYVVYMAMASIFYYVYVRKHQFFSVEEQRKFMKAYILNANGRKRRGGAGSATSSAWYQWLKQVDNRVKQAIGVSVLALLFGADSQPSRQSQQPNLSTCSVANNTAAPGNKDTAQSSIVLFARINKVAVEPSVVVEDMP